MRGPPTPGAGGGPWKPRTRAGAGAGAGALEPGLRASPGYRGSELGGRGTQWARSGQGWGCRAPEVRALELESGYPESGGTQNLGLPLHPCPSGGVLGRSRLEFKCPQGGDPSYKSPTPPPPPNSQTRGAGVGGRGGGAKFPQLRTRRKLPRPARGKTRRRSRRGSRSRSRCGPRAPSPAPARPRSLPPPRRPDPVPALGREGVEGGVGASPRAPP